VPPPAQLACAYETLNGGGEENKENVAAAANNCNLLLPSALVNAVGSSAKAGMAVGASGAAAFLNLPTNAVVELGSKIEI
jgi:hypothetical protein